MKSFKTPDKKLHMVPPLNALRAFDAAARHESFSMAAEELGVTHTAISHQIRKLEDWSGTKLFRREGRSVRLTSTGRALLGRTEGLFVELSAIGRQFRIHDRKDTLVVGCIPSIATHWLVPNLHDFSRENPELELQVMYAGMNDQLMESTYDALITYIDQTTEDVVGTPVLSRKSFPACSPEYLRKSGPFETPDAMLSADLLHDETKDSWAEWFRKAGAHAPGHLAGPVYQDFNLLVVSAIAGHGLALCPVDAFRNELARGDLVVVSDIAINEDKHYRIFTRKAPGTAVTTFATWFQETCEAGLAS